MKRPLETTEALAIEIRGGAAATASAYSTEKPEEEITNPPRKHLSVVPPASQSSSKTKRATQKPAPAKLNLDSQKMSVVIVTTIAALAAYLPGLEELAAAVLEPNVFYEPWMLMPSLKALGAGKHFVFALVFAPAMGDPDGPKTLCGFFPMVREKRYKGLPVSVLRLWQHHYCPLCTPLVRPQHADQSLKAFFDWLADPKQDAASGAPLIEMRYISGDGPFNQLLVDHLYNSAQFSTVEDRFTRAVFEPAENAEEYVNNALSGRRRKDLRLQAKHLGEQGTLEYSELTADGNVEEWMTEFLMLEASGWKGKEGTAIASRKEDEEFFREIAREGFQRGRLRMLSLNLDGHPIAQKFDLTTGEDNRYRYALKMAYDEKYSNFSPGVLLELDNLRRMHNPAQHEWVDSCAVPEHFMMNRLYTKRRVIKTILIATGRKPGRFVVSVLPLMRWFNRIFRHPEKQVAEKAQNKE